MATVSSPNLESQAFFDSLSRGRRGILVIDFDSTIARLGHAEGIFPYPTVREVLDSILGMTGTRVIVASARPAEELQAYFAQPGPEIWSYSDLAAMDGDVLGGSVPLAYLTGEGSEAAALLPAGRLRVWRFRVGPGTDEGAPAEELVQFLMEWLRACTGEIC